MKNILITKIGGGLGNQMFQYAAAFNYAQINDFELKLDLNWFKQYKNKDFPRDFVLNVFNLNYKIASNKEIYLAKGGYFFLIISYINKIIPGDNYFSNKLKGLINKIDFRFSKKITEDNYFNNNLNNNKYIYMTHTFAKDKFFTENKEAIKNIFKLKEKYISINASKFINLINSSESVSIHIRRGDYEKIKRFAKIYILLNIDYYKNAVNIINSKINKAKFFVFSDDIAWCKNNFKFLEPNVIYVEHLENYEDLYLISQCKHNIMANSTFSWWGAYLNTNLNNITICPKKLKNFEKEINDTASKNWIKI